MQDIQQALARNAGNYMTCATYFLAAIVDIDVIPDHEVVSDLLVRFIIGPLERGQRPVRKYDAPAVGDICGVALDDGNSMRGIGFFDEQATIETCRACAEDSDLHLALLPGPLSISASLSSWARPGTVGKSTSSSHPASS